MKRGEIFFADLSPVKGSEQGGVRPVLLIQNDLGNRHGSTLIVAAITTQKSKANLPTHIELPKALTGLKRDSMILVEQIRTIDKCRVQEKVCQLTVQKMQEVDRALRISLSLDARKKG
ncbi:type II toxin-antitoxin system PemK/MazF family toxin [Enterococcus sp.]|uniref:type II toxin-antitoxin system PemK/MazF family toxin n=1 Tax=Enterococcus sp. TaxID=35783 RepID=UPI002FC69BAF